LIFDRVGHEDAHLAAMRWLGYSAEIVRFDFRWADFGFAGAIDGVRRVTGDPARDSRDRSVIAAIGPLRGSSSLDHPSARVDRRAVDLNREPGWSVDAWRWLATERARDLGKHEPFAYTGACSSSGSTISATTTSSFAATTWTHCSNRSPVPASFQGRRAPLPRPPPASQ
jgi:hypothetical protein